MVHLPTCTIKINQMWVNITYIDPMGKETTCFHAAKETNPRFQDVQMSLVVIDRR